MIFLNLCLCGCNEIVYGNRRFIYGHNSKGKNNPSKLPGVGNKISRSKIGFKFSEESKFKMSKSHLSQIPWNKGLVGVMNVWNKGKLNCFSNSTIEKMRVSRTGEKNPNFGKHFSEEHRKKLSIANLGHPAAHCSGRGRWSFYDSKLQGRIRLRSSYELAYAKYLDSINEPWLYEIFSFKFKDRSYTPDFYLLNLNKFIEIKGYMYPEDKLKIDMFREIYFQETLDVLFRDDLQKLGIVI